MRITQHMMVENLRSIINTSGEKLTDLQDQLASGKRLRRPSDDPQDVNKALKLKATSQQNDQYLRNISNAKSWLEDTDSALDQLSNVLIRARDVAVRGSSDTLGQSERDQLATQVDSMLAEALQDANADHQDQYLFAGRRVKLTGGSLPFEVTGSSLSYNGDTSGYLKLEIEKNTSPLSISILGATASTGTGTLGDALNALISLRDGLQSGSISTISAQLTQISTSLDDVADLRGQVGAKVSRLDETETALNSAQTRVASLLSRAQDTDVADVMTKLTMQENVYRTSLAAGARVIQQSLLDFLK